MKFCGLCLVTADLPRLVRFYEAVFDTCAAGDAQHAELHFAGLDLAIFSLGGMEEMAPGSTTGAGTGRAVLEFVVTDVDGQYERLKTFAVELVKPPQTHPWGCRSFWFRDPDGNLLDFLTPVAN